MVFSMPVVHEQVHQRAGRQQQIRQRTEGVCQVFGQQEIARDSAHEDQPQRIA